MSGCSNGSCKCGSNCSCGSGCNCKYPDLETTSTGTIIGGVASVKMYSEGSEMGYGAENDCKCGTSCSCSSCGCHK